MPDAVFADGDLGAVGFASPDLYEACEENDCKYVIRLKQNSTLVKLAADADEALYRVTRQNQIDYAVEYGEFMYQAGTWSMPSPITFSTGSDASRYRPVCADSALTPLYFAFFAK